MKKETSMTPSIKLSIIYKQKSTGLNRCTFGGAGGYCLRVRLVTNLMTTGLDRLNFLSRSV
jgi:hypothetical protein